MGLSLSFRFIIILLFPLGIGVIGLITFEYLYMQHILMKWQTHLKDIHFVARILYYEFILLKDATKHNQKQHINIYLRKSKMQKYLTIKHINIVNEKSQTVDCSMREYDLRLCEQYKYDLQQRNFLYLNQWFHVNIFQINKLTAEQKNRLYKSIHFMFLSKIFYNDKRDDLIDVAAFTNTYSDSLMTLAPSRLVTFANQPRETCNGPNNLENYDPRCRQWYQDALKKKRMVVSVPFISQSLSDIGFIVSQRNDDVDGEFLSMMNYRIGVKNLKNKIFQYQDVLDESDPLEGYTVVFHQFNQTIIHHRYWDSEQGNLTKWKDMEYNKSISYTQEEKQQFENNIQFITEQAQTNDYSVKLRENIKKFYFAFSRNHNKYVALIYPIDIMSIQSTSTKKVVFDKQIFVARVSKDRTKIIENVTLDFLPSYQILNNCELVLVIIWLILNLLHYAAVLYNSIDMQVLQLSYAIKNNIVDKKCKKQTLNKVTIANYSKVNTLNFFFNPYQQKKIILTNQSTQITQENALQGDSFVRQNTDQIKQIQRKISSSRVLNSRISPRDRQSTKDRKKSLNSILTLPQLNSEQSNNSIYEQNKTYYVQNQNSNSNELRKIDLKDINQTFHEMEIIVESIKRIFQLLSLAKFNDHKGLNDMSIIQFTQVLQIFVKVRNFPQQIDCYKKIGNQYLKAQRHFDAIQAYQSALNIIIMQFHLESYQQFVEYLKESKCTRENISYIDDFVYILRMLSLTQKEKFIFFSNQRNPQLLSEAMINIKICRQLLLLFKNHFSNVQFFLTELIRIEILTFTNSQQAYNECSLLEIQLQNYILIKTQQLELNSPSKLENQQDINNCKVINQSVCLIKQKILMDYGQLHLACTNITNFLESSDYIEEFLRFDSLSLLQKSFQISNIPQDSSLINEINKYNGQNLKVTFIIELDQSISVKSFEYYLISLQKFINKNLQPEDEITFIVMNSEFIKISAPFKKNNTNFILICLKEIKKQFLNEQEADVFSNKSDLINIFQYIIFLEKQDVFCNPLKLYSHQYSTSNQEKRCYLLFQFKNVMNDEFVSRLQEYLEQIKNQFEQINAYSNSIIDIIHIHHSHVKEPETYCKTMRTIDLPRGLGGLEQMDHNSISRKISDIFTPRKFNNPSFLQFPSRNQQNIRSKRGSSKMFNLNTDDSQCFKTSKSDLNADFEGSIQQIFKNSKNITYFHVKNFQDLANEFNQIRYTKPSLNSIYFL